MQIDPVLIVNAMIFLGALLAFEGLRDILTRGGREERAVSRRMKLIKTGKTSEEVLKQLRRPADRDSTFGLPFLRTIAAKLRKAGMTTKAGHFFLAQIAAALLLFMVASQLTAPWKAATAALVLTLFLPIAVLDHRARSREKKLVEQLPEALDQMARGLKVGHPVNTTMANVAATMPDPIGTEFGLVSDQVAYGDDLVDAVAEMADRLDNEDVHYFTVALGIQHGTGGNLGRILSTLATVIRDRDMMRRRIRAISSEGRMTMYCMTALNPLLFIVMQIINPSYFGAVMDDPAFMWAMGFVAVMTVFNYLALKRQTNFRV